MHPFDPPENPWLPGDRLPATRLAHSATLLADGRVFVAGGRGRDTLYASPLDRKETLIYWPAIHKWTESGLMDGHVLHKAVRVDDGRILMVHLPGFQFEFFDPVKESFWMVPGYSSFSPWEEYAVAKLNDGRVFMSGGIMRMVGSARGSTRDWIGVFDPRDDTMHEQQVQRRRAHSATVLESGEVLIAGGWDRCCGAPGPYLALESCEIYDPATNTVRPAAPLAMPTGHHEAVRLLDGRVLLFGGRFDATQGLPVPAQTTWLDRCALYDPQTDTWAPAAPLPSRRSFRWDHDAPVLLPDGRVLIVGGWDVDEANDEVRILDTTVLYDPAADAWAPGPTMTRSRFSHTAILLEDGRVLVVGGMAYDSSLPSQPEINHDSVELLGPGF